MSRNNGKMSKLQELQLSLSSRSRGGPSSANPAAAGGPSAGSPRRLSSSSSSTTTASPPSSCVSSEGSPEAGVGAPMILAGCPRCMMYVMLSREDPRCPKCHSTVLLDFDDAGPGPGGKSNKGRRG